MVGSNLRVLLAGLLFVAPSACGGSNSASAVADCTLIDDMEGQSGSIRWSPLGGWPSGQEPGFWASSTDCTEADRILPPPYFDVPSGWSYDLVPTPYQTMAGITSVQAAHLRTKFGQVLENVWGANMGFDFAEQTDADGGAAWPPATGVDAGTSADGKPCRQGSSRDFSGVEVDLSAYSGFTFWAMAEPDGRQSLRVQINDWYTDPRGGQCNEANGDCYNGYKKDLMLTSTFTQYRVDFSALQQDPSWGNGANGVPLDLTRVYSVNFEVALPGCVTDPKAVCAGGPAPVSFDVWIDDLYFVNRP